MIGTCTFDWHTVDSVTGRYDYEKRPALMRRCIAPVILRVDALWLNRAGLQSCLHSGLTCHDPGSAAYTWVIQCIAVFRDSDVRQPSLSTNDCSLVRIQVEFAPMRIGVFGSESGERLAVATLHLALLRMSPGVSY